MEIKNNNKVKKCMEIPGYSFIQRIFKDFGFFYLCMCVCFCVNTCTCRGQKQALNPEELG